MSRTRIFAVMFAAALAPALSAAPARVTFVRTIRPAHDLNAEKVTVVYAIGDNQNVTLFVDDFVEFASRGGTLRVENAVDNNQHLRGFSEASLRALRREHPADVYVGVSLFSCAGAERNGEVGDTAPNGERVRTKVQWLDAVCSAKIDVRKPDGKQLVTFMTHGDGTSPRAAALTSDEREIAYEQAAHFAAIAAAESIAPRVQREAIELDERAPEFDNAMAMINSERLTDARAIWEVALARHHNSAPLHYDLGALSEALGDLHAADEYYRTAVRLAPTETRYRTELRLLHKRNAQLK